MACSTVADLDEPAIWTDDEPLECCSVVPEAPNVATISFVSPSGAWFRYQPGQFLTLELPVPGGTVWRTYTISSSPSRPLTLGDHRQGAERQHRHTLDARPPARRDADPRPAARREYSRSRCKVTGKYLFISAGTGHHAVARHDELPVRSWPRGSTSFWSVAPAARRDHLPAAPGAHGVSRVPTIKLHFIVEQEDPYDVWTGYRGRLNQIMLGLIASDYLEREVYCCGPEPFMQAVRDMLIALGFDMERYHQESFAYAVETEEDAPELDDFVPDEAQDGRARLRRVRRDGKPAPRSTRCWRPLRRPA